MMFILIDAPHDAWKTTLKRVNFVGSFMENQPQNTSSLRALQAAYLHVVSQRAANASMLRWSLDFAEAEKQGTAGKGVTLYLL